MSCSRSAPSRPTCSGRSGCAGWSRHEIEAARSLAPGRAGAANAALALLLARVFVGHEGLDLAAAAEAVRGVRLPGPAATCRGRAADAARRGPQPGRDATSWSRSSTACSASAGRGWPWSAPRPRRPWTRCSTVLAPHVDAVVATSSGLAGAARGGARAAGARTGLAVEQATRGGHAVACGLRRAPAARRGARHGLAVPARPRGAVKRG